MPSSMNYVDTLESILRELVPHNIEYTVRHAMDTAEVEVMFIKRSEIRYNYSVPIPLTPTPLVQYVRFNISYQLLVNSRDNMQVLFDLVHNAINQLNHEVPPKPKKKSRLPDWF